MVKNYRSTPPAGDFRPNASRQPRKAREYSAFGAIPARRAAVFKRPPTLPRRPLSSFFQNFLAENKTKSLYLRPIFKTFIFKQKHSKNMESNNPATQLNPYLTFNGNC
ncbi:MAG: hypothetical protein D6714_21205, partial [Bacteroidetes bacterium]